MAGVEAQEANQVAWQFAQIGLLGGCLWGLFLVVLGVFVFALVLSQMAESEAESDPALLETNKALQDVRSQLRDSERARKIAEERLNTTVDMAKIFTSTNKRERIEAIYRKWPNLPNTAIAQLAESSPAHVSEVVKEFSKN